MSAKFTGGCQCGAVRYAFDVEPGKPHLCHCRMCQKAFGSFFAPLASVPLDALQWTKEPPATFKSSDIAERGFCSKCGTPLTIFDHGSGKIFLSLGSLDNPAAVKPVHQHGEEGRMPWFAELHNLPSSPTEEMEIRSFQHPDHD